MAEIVPVIQELTGLPEDIHWFCPRTHGAEDNSLYFDTDVLGLSDETQEEKETRHGKVRESINRKKQVLQACQILAFDGSDAQALQHKLTARLKTQLTRCTICVREYHRGRSELKHGLEEQYEPDEVDGFMTRFDQMNIARITSGLDTANDTLLDLEPSERKITALPMPEMFALFEAMHCVPFLRNETLLQKHFDQPFRLVQTKNKISLPEYTPALTSFLFCGNADRLQWALRGWKRFKRNITGNEFDWTVKDTLVEAMARVNITALEKGFMPTFWRGVRTIVEKLDQPLITHHLRALDMDLCKLALDHLQVDSECYIDLLGTVQLLLEISPNDVWDALGTISPQTVVEQIFNNPCIEQVMLTADETQSTHIDVALSWIGPFVKSIKATNLPPACRSIVHQTMTRYQAEQYSRFARETCWIKGMQSLAEVLIIMQTNRQISGATSADMLEVVGRYVFDILNKAEESQSLSNNESVQVNHKVIENALALDCHCLSLDRDAIAIDKSLGHDINLSSLTIWKAAIRGVKPSDTILSAKIMSGVRKLLVLEPLTKKQIDAAPKVATAWNSGIGRAQSYVVEFLERLQDFSAAAIQQLVASQDSARSLYALLLSGNQEIQQAAATILKVASAESSRREAIRYFINKFYVQSLNSFSVAFRAIARSKTFTTSRTVLKVGADFLESLFGSQDGILRTRTLSNEESTATENAWQSLWLAISMIFECTESWSQIGHDKAVLVEFCRDAMDFAEQTFDKYSVVSGALQDTSAKSSDTSELDKRFLGAPRDASIHVFKWLRLRDDYLISKAVSIACSVMSRLQDAHMALPEEATFYIDDVLAGTTRSRLTIAQKAELRRALEKHLGQTPTTTPEPELHKPQKQGSLSSWVTPGTGPLSVSTTERKKQTIDLDAWRSAAGRPRDVKDVKEEAKKVLSVASPTFEMLKSKGEFANRSIGPGMQRAAQQHRASPNDFRRKRQEELEAKKKRDAAAIAALKKNAAGIGEAGSGLAGLGVEGKDHAAKGQGVMVSSDEESEDSDGGLDAELFGLKPKTSKRKNTVAKDAAGAIGLKPEQRKGPVKLQRQVRSHKDMRARLAPDLAPLHKIILGWDFFHEGDYPPNAKDWQFQKVSPSFRHVGDYKDTFQPLLTLEAWQGFVRSREENVFKEYEIKVGSRSSVDAFLEISTSMSHAENKDVMVGDGDIILFSQAKKPTSNPEAPHCLARVYRINRRKQHLEVIYRVMPGTPLNALLTPGSIIYGTKIQSITPLEREYGALSGLQYYDLCDEIIKAKPSPLLNYTDKQLDPLINNYTVNKAQAKAVRSAIDNDAFTLIQGPPGSGKTKTIVAIVGALLTDSIAGQSAATRIDIPKSNGNFSNAQATSKKLLVCAPSNAAVDELVMRLKEGIKTTRGMQKKINVVRLGRSDAINSNVVDVTMDELVNKRLGSVNRDNNARERTQGLMKEHQKVSEQLRNTREQLDGGQVKGDDASKLQDEFNNLRRRKNELGTQIDNAKDAENAAGRTADLERKKVQQAVLDESHVICATLSGSGHDMFQSLNIEFETVVVDEAAQCVEMSALIPLKYGCAKCILVGDPKQLPPTVFSKEAARFQYEQSLFVRMQANFPDAVHLLDTQYRMHPDISAFPSATFYDGRLLDGAGMAELRQQPWHKSSLLAPYRFFDVEGQHQAAPKGHSLVNRAEIDVAMSLYDRLTKDFGNYDFANRIGIITPYKSQLRELKERFSQRYGREILDVVEFNTTDAFQGRESEVIIFSCVRASPAGGIGFLQDIRRMNVGLTRAKSSLWVLGNSQSLIRGEFWKKLVNDAQERDLYTRGDLTAMLRQTSSKYPAKNRPVVSKKTVTTSTNSSVAQVKMDPAMKDRGIVPISNARVSNGHNNHSEKNQASSRDGYTDDSRMEGIKVKLEDKLSAKRGSTPGSSRTGSPAPQPDTVSRISDQDVEMADADGANRSGTMTPQERVGAQMLKRPRSETPGSGAEGRPNAPHRAPGAPSQPGGPPVIRKRKPADPFMPKTKQPRRG